MKWISVFYLTYNLELFYALLACKMNNIYCWVSFTKLCTHPCECVGTTNSSSAGEWVSRNLRFYMHILFCINAFCLILIMCYAKWNWRNKYTEFWLIENYIYFKFGFLTFEKGCFSLWSWCQVGKNQIN